MIVPCAFELCLFIRYIVVNLHARRTKWFTMQARACVHFRNQMLSSSCAPFLARGGHNDPIHVSQLDATACKTILLMGVFMVTWVSGGKRVSWLTC